MWKDWKVPFSFGTYEMMELTSLIKRNINKEGIIFATTSAHIYK